MSNQPIVFNIQYTPYKPRARASPTERAAHREEREFYDMTGTKNLYDYMTTEEKIADKFNVLDYFQKTTGVFNGQGFISAEEVQRMRERLKNNKGNIFHGFISFNEEESKKIDTPDKCIAFIKATFGKFLEDAHFSKKNVDLMCSLHVDRPKHLHIHFSFWEKEPKTKRKDGTTGYRAKGKIAKSAIDNFFVRANLYIASGRDKLYETRVSAINALRGMTYFKKAMSKADIRDEVIALAKELPKEGRLAYGSENMKPYKGRVDRIVRMLLDNDGKARRADDEFYKELQSHKRRIEKVCGQKFLFAGGNVKAEDMEKDGVKYNNVIDVSNIRIAEEIEEDYRRRQGNLVINLAKFIKPEIYESRIKRANSNRYKRRRAVSERKIRTLFGRFLKSFCTESIALERGFSNRLQEIEEEKERAEKQNEKGGKR